MKQNGVSMLSQRRIQSYGHDRFLGRSFLLVFVVIHLCAFVLSKPFAREPSALKKLKAAPALVDQSSFHP
jgi:hypothetical protein